MRLRHIYILFIVLAAAIVSPARGAATTGDSDDYVRMSAKAARFFEHGEWLNAQAMYTLMLDRRPTDADVYAHAIVANAMESDTAGVMRLLEQSMMHNVPIDSLLHKVGYVGTTADAPQMYENLLHAVADHFPWLRRSMNLHLLEYYNFRDNGAEMVRYANMMLAGMPDNPRFNAILARGYMLTGDYDRAVQTWQKMLELAPESYDVLLDIGNYYVAADDPAAARPYLERAQAIRPTPYVAALLAR